MALAEAGGRDGPVDTEDIAMKAYEIAPAIFSWRKYPEQVNLDGVRVALTDAVKPANGALVEGSLRTGWLLTDRGLAWVDEVGPGVRSAVGAVDAVPRGTRAENRRVATERARVRSLPAFRRWSDGATVSPREAGVVFRIDTDTPPRTRSMNTRRAKELLGDDPELGAFLEAMAAIASGIPTRGP